MQCSVTQPLPPSPPRIIIAGGSGFLGTALTAHLTAHGADVTILTRTPRANSPWRHAHWDARTLADWATHLDRADALVNLTGRSVNCIKTPDHCDEILRSRIESTLALGRACRAVHNPPPVWVQMSTAHIYGDPPTTPCDEDSPTGTGLAPDVGRAWEAAFAEARLPTQRGVVLRTSVVIGKPNQGGEGALGTLGRLARFGLGDTVASGTQGMSWIHEHDLHRTIDHALADATMQGVYVVSAPHPVSNREFMRTLRRHAGGLGALGLALPAAAWMVRLGAPLLLRTDPELALYGRYVLPTRLTREGFTFTYPTLATALAHL